VAPNGGGEPRAGRVFAIGHFGNFELFARAAQSIPSCQGATTYRALKSPALSRLLLRLRDQSGCLFFERRTEGAALRQAVRNQRLFLGLLADQHSGDHGLRLPFFGQECATTKAPAIFALRFGLPLHTAICFRTRLGHWRIELGDEIPTHVGGRPRPPEAIMLEVNRAFETAIRRDPANWFWVHNRWKSAGVNVAKPKPGAEAAGLELDGGEERARSEKGA
jgi:lauroyl/myristoyl acyltransferase